ncbi:MAG: thermosome, alpha chain [Thermoplasmatales archaeon A-plasma]|nr:MAG: thermosome, alpha chain [Thermoplasmatales archaeon A-plasma]
MRLYPGHLQKTLEWTHINTLIQLKAEHEKGHVSYGIDIEKNGVGDMKKIGVFDPLRVKKHALESAVEVSTMILRIDDVIASKKSGAEGGSGQGGAPGGMGGMGGMPPY